MPSGKELDPEILRRAAKAVLREHEADSITNGLETERAHWEQWVDDLRVLCMSERNDLATMWAHYAIDHKGVVLALDFRDDAHEMAWQIAKKVNYTDEQCSSASLDGLVEDYANYRVPNHFDETCLLKKLEWKNEREWRAVTIKRPEESGLFSDWSYDPSTVLALYLGINMEKDDKEEIVKLFRDGYPHSVIYQACASPPDKIVFETV